MDWTGSNRANIFMDHNYFKCEPMGGDKTNVTAAEQSNPNKMNGTKEGGGGGEEGITRCICDFDHDDGYMMSCDGCMVWQHVDCVGDRDSIPEKYYCEVCHPRKFDKHKAIRIQSKKREDILAATFRGVDDLSATETEDETKGNEDEDNKYARYKKSLESIPHRKYTRSQRIERTKKDFKQEKKKDVSVRKHLKRNNNKQQAAPNNRSRDNNTNPTKSQDVGLHQILEAINHKEHRSVRSSPPPSSPNHVNSYTPELQTLLPNIKYNQDNLNSFSPSQLNGLRKSLCRATPFDNDPDRLVLRATCDIAANCPVVEYVGKVMLRDQFHDRWQPHVLFYSELCGLDLCIDATSFVNSDAIHVRRSCTPNADIRHYLQENSLRFFLHSTKDVPSGSEITIGFDFNYHKCGFPVECACTRASCPVAKYQRKECNLKKSHSTRDNNKSDSTPTHNSMHKRPNNKSNQNGVNSRLQSPIQSPVKMSDRSKMLNSMTSTFNKVRTSSESSNHRPSLRHSMSRESDSEHTDSYNMTSPNDEKENSQKKSREEKKLEFYVKVIEKLEKSEKDKKGVSSKYKYKKEGRKLHFNDKNREPCLDSLADAAAALASLSGNIDMSTLQKEDIHNISKRYTMLQTSSTCISPDAFNTNASNPHRRQSDASSSSHDRLDRSFSSPASYLADTVRVKEERNSFSSSDTHLDAATTLSLMSCQIQSPEDSKQNIVKVTNIPQGFESENLPLQEPEGAFTHNDQDVRGCSVKKRWLSRAMVSRQSSDGGDIATPPKKRRLARESVASDDINEIENSEPITSVEQKPPETKSSYQPVCESITDDEDEDQQQNEQSNMYCMPPGMVYPSFTNLSTNGLYGLHPAHPLYSMPGAMMDPYQYYSSLNLLQNMAMTSTPIHHPFANQANGIPTSTDSFVRSAEPIDGEKPTNVDGSDAAVVQQQDLPFVHTPYTMPQQFFHKSQNMMEAYFPFVMFPGAHQFPYPIPPGIHPIGPQMVQLNDGSSMDLHSPHANHNEKRRDSDEKSRTARIEMISPPSSPTPPYGAGFAHNPVNSQTHSGNDSLT